MDRAKGKIIQLFDEESVTETDSEDADSDHDLPVEVGRLLKKAENLLGGAETEDKEELIELMEEIKDALKADDKDKLTEAASELAEIIFYMES